jgi:hypothetical protein
MKSRFTDDEREAILIDYCKRHNRSFDAEGFAAEVESTGPKHPAFAAFTWDVDVGMHRLHVEEARAFSRGLKITWSETTITRSGPIKVTHSMPLLLSPPQQRLQGGGYILSDPNNPEHMIILTEEAAGSLRAWTRRYEAALAHVSIPLKTLERIVHALEEAANPGKEAA